MTCDSRMTRFSLGDLMEVNLNDAGFISQLSFVFNAMSWWFDLLKYHLSIQSNTL